MTTISKALAIGVIALAGQTFAEYTWKAKGNPIVTHIRAADPSVHVWEDGKLWVYASHDQDNATSYASMDGYHVFSTSDLETWTDHGEVLHSRDVPWAQGGYMWAPDCAYKNGTYYLYFPTKAKNGSWVIGVATSSKPQGPFVPESSYIKGTSGTDPMCFIDDDGTAYLYFGSHKVARLKSNMKELAENPRSINFGTNSSEFEGSWMHKRNGKYYYSWTNWDAKDQGLYSMGNSPYGPFVHKGAVAGSPSGAQDHHSIVEFKGKWYYFYHIGRYNTNQSYRRNFCADYLYYNSDGTMKKVVYTNGGVKPIDGDDGGSSVAIAVPGKIEAEAFSSQSGISTENTSDSGGGKNIGWVDSGDWMDYKINVAQTGSYDVEFRVASYSETIKLNLQKGSALLTSVSTSSTGGWQSWKTVKKTINLSRGVQTLRVKATGSAWNLNWMKMTLVEEDDGGGGVSGDPRFLNHKSSGKRLRYRSTGDYFVLVDEDGEWAQWKVISVDSTWFYLEHLPTGLRLGSSDGTTVKHFSGNSIGGDAQWKVKEEGVWDRLIHRSSGNRLHIKPNGAYFRLGPNNWTGDNTRWQLQP